ncbi:hypothetical protein Syun_012593 [Stephania yunnanensis]|uniref:Uncharacterized protein n=1 Tax=Stephania yunnanensis TaxID=152371 RepID=A0AAP0K138_9MAGN
MRGGWPKGASPHTAATGRDVLDNAPPTVPPGKPRGGGRCLHVTQGAQGLYLPRDARQFKLPVFRSRERDFFRATWEPRGGDPFVHKSHQQLFS